ncbi:MAG: hypothetical protein J5545_09135 [Bacteroidaceae bacterium]|nr:hypothetical protein [Bacteroidaceae bacterium]
MRKCWPLDLRLILLLFTFHSFTFHSAAQQLHLFSPELRQAAGRQALIMDFVEHYFNDLFTKSAEMRATKMADDKVFFRKGRPEDLRHLADTIPFSITFHDKFYEVSWSQADEPFITMVFPAKYDLILGLSQDEVQKRTKDYILAAPPRDSLVTVPDSLTLTADSLLISKHSFLELESLTDATYYIYNKVYAPDTVPVFDSHYPEASAANLFMGIIHNKDYRLYVEQSLYGMKTVSYTLALSQWLNYCAEQQLQVFFAVEEVREDGIKALVIAHSRELNYNHLLSVIIPDHFIDREGIVLKARMTPFIPTHNIKNLYKVEN